MTFARSLSLPSEAAVCVTVIQLRPFLILNILVILAPYSTDTIRIQDYDIGHVTGMEIRRNRDGIAPDWRLDKVSSRPIN